MIKKILALSCLLSFSGLVNSVTPGDAAAYSQLVTIVKTTKEQLIEMRETLDVTNKLAEMQQSEVITELTEAGQVYGEMFEDIRDIEEQLEKVKNDPLGTKQIEDDVKRIQRRMEQAENKTGLSKAETYASLLRGLKNVEWLGKVQKTNQEKLANGTDNRDACEVGAGAALTSSGVAIEREKRELRQRAINTSVVDDFMGNVSYGGLGLFEGEEDF